VETICCQERNAKVKSGFSPAMTFMGTGVTRGHVVCDGRNRWKDGLAVWSPTKSVYFQNIVAYETNEKEEVKVGHIKEYDDLMRNTKAANNRQDFFKQKWSIVATFAEPLDFHDFPFDSHRVRIIFREGIASSHPPQTLSLNIPYLFLYINLHGASHPIIVLLMRRECEGVLYDSIPMGERRE